MKQLLTLFILTILFSSCKNNQDRSEETAPEDATERTDASASSETDSVEIDIEPISHASAVIIWDNTVFYIDPVGGAEAFSDQENPDYILITDIHGDHLDAETLQALELENTRIIVPQAVKDELPEDLDDKLVVMNNGETNEENGFELEAIPMYNLPEDPESHHTKGRGNGYVLEKDNKRLYIAGDTEDIPEMRNLENIDIALIPMNLPYTMTVEKAAEAVLDFEPKQVYPYHYRGQDGLADVEKFRELVNQENKDIEVILANWYPNEE